MNITSKHKAVPEVDFSEYRMTEDTKFTIGGFKTLRHNIARILFVMGFILKKIFKK
ncbi:hypothetical protein [Chryseobacterium sp. 'Rf worker isolate 10']|uniref:hypothetical protein n=1 Tax=Chryseobacterium sp. 'Rf worker isolate 10' TaxID=2887348 RepID=UPI003D6F0DCB